MYEITEVIKKSYVKNFLKVIQLLILLIKNYFKFVL